MQRLKAYAPSLLKPAGVTQGIQQLKRKASNSWSAVQDTYFSTKDVFERHRVVFTIGTSLASLATAWAGYSLRYAHQSKVEQRLQSIEQAMTKVHDVEREEIKKIVNSGNVSYTACFATAGTTLIIGIGGHKFGGGDANYHSRHVNMRLY